MNEALKLNIIIGSTRPGRIGPSIARWFANHAETASPFAVELIDLMAFDLPLLDEAAHPRLRQYANTPTRRWSESVASADAYVFVTPEYDFFAPASLVNAIQVVFHEWGYKPAGVVSYGGTSGGLRSSQVLRQLLGNVNVHALPQSVALPFVARSIDADGIFTPGDPARASTETMLGELHKWAGALKPLRGGTD